MMRFTESDNQKKYGWRSSSEIPSGYGSVPAEILVVGLCPSTRRPEGRKWLPFGSKFYPILSEIEKAGSVYATNLVEIPHDPGKSPKTKELREALPGFLEEVEAVDPKALLIFSSEVSKLLIPEVSIREDHGTYFHREIAEKQRIIIPTYHPRSAVESQEIRQNIQTDLERLFWVSQQGFRVQTPEFIVGEKLEPKSSGMTILDIETDGLYGDITLLGLKPVGGPAVLYDKTSLDAAFSFLQQTKATIAGHNLAYDLAVLFQNGVITKAPIFDTMIAAHILGESQLSLKSLASREVSFPGSKAWDNLHLYLSLDLIGTELLFRNYMSRIPEGPLWKTMMRWVLITARTYVSGIRIDPEKIPAAVEEIEKKSTEIQKYWGINLNSTKQLAEALIKRGIKLPKTDLGNFSTRESVLKSLAEVHPEVEDILRYRESLKLKQFLEQYQGNRLLHPHLKPWGTETGRFSCEEPNLQQVPREGFLKTLFTSRFGSSGRILLVDLSQAELRVAVLITGDLELARVLMTSDVHRTIASAVFGKPAEEITSTERKWSKRVTFGLLYGGSPSGLGEKFGLPKQEIQRIFDSFLAVFPGVRNYIESTRRNPPRMVVTPTGRVRNLSAFFPENVNAAVRRGINTPIQSLASDLMLIIGAESDMEFAKTGLEARVYFPIHDSIYIDLLEEEVDSVVQILGKSFLRLKEHIREVRLKPIVPIVGDGATGLSWAAVESTNEHYSPERKFVFSTEFGFHEEQDAH